MEDVPNEVQKVWNLKLISAKMPGTFFGKETLDDASRIMSVYPEWFNDIETPTKKIKRMQYGLMPEHDYRTMDKVLSMVCDQFKDEGIIRTLEIGVHKGNTSRGIHRFISEMGKANFHTGIDNCHDLQVQPPFEGCNLILGSSIEVYNHIANESQHFVFIDGCHNFPMTVADFFCYKDKVKKGGFIAFHDTGSQIPLFKDYQGMGDKAEADMFIACRKAVKSIGLIDDTFPGWKKVIDEYDTKFDTGGILVVQKIN